MMIFCWTGCCVFLFAFVKTLQEDYSTIGLSIFLIVASLFLLWGGIQFWKMGKRSKRKTTSESVLIKLKNEWLVKRKKKAEAKKRIEHQYLVLQEDLRLLQETVELMKSAKSIDLLLDRFNLACRMASNIEKGKKAGIPFNHTFMSDKELRELTNRLIPIVINDSYLKMKMGTFKLDRKEEQLERFESYLHLLKKYENDIAFASNYMKTIANVEDDINHLKKAQFT